MATAEDSAADLDLSLFKRRASRENQKNDLKTDV